MRAPNNPTNFQELHEFYHTLNKEQQLEYQASLPEDAFIAFRYFTDIPLRPAQIIPGGRWKVIVLIGGRGSGKTKTGASEIRKQTYAKNQGIMLVAPTFPDLEETMIPAIQDEFPDKHKPIWVPGKKIIKCHNGVQIMCKTTEQSSIRGKNTQFCWLDEVPNCWKGDLDKQLKEFLILMANIRQGNAQIIITTTGEPTPLFKFLFDMAKERPDRFKLIYMGKTDDNIWLSDQTAEDLHLMYGNSRFARQELDGYVDFTQDGALWTQALINKTRSVSTKTNPTWEDHLDVIANPPNPRNIKPHPKLLTYFWRIYIGIDPSATVSETSDETGIVVAGLGMNNQIYVLEDLSGKYTPPQTVGIVQRLLAKYGTKAKIAVEVNNGGDWVVMGLRTIMSNKEIERIVEPIHAQENKMTRAQYQIIYWDQGRAHIVGYMPELEQQMCFYTGDPKQASPDRFDAMVYAIQALAAEPNFHKVNYDNLPRL